ncbi:MAG: OsmC family protein [Acidobacteriaceae bacterium]
MQAKVSWKSGTMFEGTTQSGHTLLLDRDPAHKLGPSSMEVALVTLCSCTAMDVYIILQKKHEPITGLTVTAQAEQAPDPPQVFTKIHLVYHVQGKVTPKAVEDAIHLSETKYCSVAAMLRSTAEIDFEIEYVD